MKKLITIIFFILACNYAYCQLNTYIPPNGKIWIFKGKPVSIYGSIINEGTIGSNPDAELNFFGKSWKNAITAKLIDESEDGYTGKGGIFRFSGNNPVNGNLGAQTVYCGFSVSANKGISFPNLAIDNKLGLILDDLSDLKVRNNLHFSNGFIFLNGWNLVVGDKQPGTITGYNDKAFVVTGTNIAGGFLYREAISRTSGKVVFPIGTSISNYSPAAIEYKSDTPDDFKARVFDSVYSQAIDGVINKLEYANKTWNIGHLNESSAEVVLYLQHMDKDEGANYAAFRSLSFISRYTDTAWDYISALQFNPITGNLTTGGPLTSSTLHQRLFNEGLDINEYFTKSSFIAGPYSPAIFMYFNAYRNSPYLARLEWATSRELNNDHFEIERRYDKDTAFTTVGSVLSSSINGNSEIFRQYMYDDPNDYEGWTYYRIKSVSKNDRVSYTETRAVPPFLRVEVWPNPNYGQFTVRIKGENSSMIMRIVNVLGQTVRTYDITGETNIQVNDIARGMYVLAFYDKNSGKLIRTHKIVVIDRY